MPLPSSTMIAGPVGLGVASSLGAGHVSRHQQQQVLVAWAQRRWPWLVVAGMPVLLYLLWRWKEKRKAQLREKDEAHRRKEFAALLYAHSPRAAMETEAATSQADTTPTPPSTQLTETAPTDDDTAMEQSGMASLNSTQSHSSELVDSFSSPQPPALLAPVARRSMHVHVPSHGSMGSSIGSGQLLFRTPMGQHIKGASYSDSSAAGQSTHTGVAEAAAQVLRDNPPSDRSSDLDDSTASSSSAFDDSFASSATDAEAASAAALALSVADAEAAQVLAEVESFIARASELANQEASAMLADASRTASASGERTPPLGSSSSSALLQTPVTLYPRSGRPTLSASLELPSRSGSRAVSTHQSRTQSPRSTVARGLNVSVLHGSGGGGGGASGSRQPFSPNHPYGVAPRALHFPRGSPIASEGSNARAYKVHYFDEIKLPPHVHPLKKGVGAAEGSPLTPRGTAGVDTSPSAPTTPSSAASSTTPHGTSTSLLQQQVPAPQQRPLGFFRPTFEPKEDLILVTGATGFLGVHVLKVLLEDDEDDDEEDLVDDADEGGESDHTPSASPLPPPPPKLVVCLVRPASLALSTLDQDAAGESDDEEDEEDEDDDSQEDGEDDGEQHLQQQQPQDEDGFVVPSTPRHDRPHRPRRRTRSAGHAFGGKAFGFPRCTDPSLSIHLAKLRESFGVHGVAWRRRWERRLVLLPGDVSLPHLGLDGFHYHQLVLHTHTVFHLAGFPGLSSRTAFDSAAAFPYSALKYTCVEATKRVLEFCVLMRRKILVFPSTLEVLRAPMSTMAKEERDALLREILAQQQQQHSAPSEGVAASGAFFPPSHDRGRTPSSTSSLSFASSSHASSSSSSLFSHSNESTPLPTYSTSHLTSWANGFVQTKWVCENLLRQAFERGVPVLIGRLGDLMAPTVETPERPTSAPESAFTPTGAAHEAAGAGHAYIDGVSRLLIELTKAGVAPVPVVSASSLEPPMDSSSPASGGRGVDSPDFPSSFDLPSFHLLPVNTAARALVFLAATYYLAHPPPAISPLNGAAAAGALSLSSSNLLLASSTSDLPGGLHHPHQHHHRATQSGSSSIASTSSIAGSEYEPGSAVAFATTRAALKHHHTSSVMFTSSMLPTINPQAPTFHIMQHHGLEDQDQQEADPSHARRRTTVLSTPPTAKRVHQSVAPVSLTTLLSFASAYGFLYSPSPIPFALRVLLAQLSGASSSSASAAASSTVDPLVVSPTTSSLLSPEQLLDLFQCGLRAGDYISDERTRHAIRDIQLRLGLAHTGRGASYHHGAPFHSIVSRRRAMSLGQSTMQSCDPLTGTPPPTLDRPWAFNMIDHLVARGLMPTPPAPSPTAAADNNNADEADDGAQKPARRSLGNNLNGKVNEFSPPQAQQPQQDQEQQGEDEYEDHQAHDQLLGEGSLPPTAVTTPHQSPPPKASTKSSSSNIPDSASASVSGSAASSHDKRHAIRTPVATAADSPSGYSTDVTPGQAPMSGSSLFTPAASLPLHMRLQHALPTPSAFLSPAPNTVLSFLTPSSGSSSGGGGVGGDEAASASSASPLPISDDLFNGARSPIGLDDDRARTLLTFGSVHQTPAGSAEKARHQQHHAHLPPMHGNGVLLSNTGSGSGSGGSVLHPIDSNSSLSLLSIPSTPPTNKQAKGTKRAPPAAGSRVREDLPHISTAAARRHSMRARDAQMNGLDSSAPLMGARGARAPLGLSALLNDPSPLLQPSSLVPPHSMPFSSLASSSDGATELDADTLHLALEGESSLMQALNSAAKKGTLQRVRRQIAGSGEATGEEETEAAAAAASGDALAHPSITVSAAASSSSSSSAATTTAFLSLPSRTLSAPSPLQQLTSPMISRSASSPSSSWATLILPGLYLGNAKHAFDLNQLVAHGVTHVLNSADDVPNYHPTRFHYKNLHVADNGRDAGIRRVFKTVYAWVTKSGFHLTKEEDLEQELARWTNNNAEARRNTLAGAGAGAAASASAASSSDHPPVVILLHCAKGANRSVAILLALLMQLYPTWTLDQAHARLLASKHYQTCPFVDNRTELLHFERQRFGENSMTDKDFCTRFPIE